MARQVAQLQGPNTATKRTSDNGSHRGLWLCNGTITKQQITPNNSNRGQHWYSREEGVVRMHAMALACSQFVTINTHSRVSVKFKRLALTRINISIRISIRLIR